MLAGNDKEMEFYALRTDKLCAGDVILTSSPGVKSSELIRFLARAKVSHAILVLDPPFAIEASDYGVIRFIMDRFAARDRRNVHVRRLKPDLRPHIQAPIGYAISWIEYEYSTADLVFYPSAFLPKLRQSGFICSELVAEAFRQGGLELYPGRPSHKISPELLLRSDCFEELTDIFIKTGRDSVTFNVAYFDAPTYASANEKMSEITTQIFRDSIRAFPDNGFRPRSFPEAIKMFAQCYHTFPENLEKLIE
jgi:hypothetical protein